MSHAYFEDQLVEQPAIGLVSGHTHTNALPAGGASINWPPVACVWRKVRRILAGVILLLLSAPVQAQFTFTTNNGTITVAGYDCSGGNVVIPNQVNGLPVTRIGNYSFWACDTVTSVTIPNSVTNIGSYAFAICLNLTNVAFGTGVKTVQDLAFYHCNSLTNISLPDNLQNIGDHSFSCDNLATVYVGSGLTNIYQTAFSECPRLTNISVSANNPAFSSSAGVLFDKAQTALICFPGGKAGSYYVPSSVLRIGEIAFIYCSLTNVSIPGTVTNIGNYAFQSSRLTSLTMSNGVGNIGTGAFLDCTNLTSVTIPGSVGIIGEWAFQNCFSLTNVTVSDGVTTIKQGAFGACSSLPSIIIPASVTNVGIVTFASCPTLATIYFQGNAPSVEDNSVFYADQSVTAYYLPGTTGWDGFAQVVEIPTKIWLPRMQTSNSNFGVQTNAFGFNVLWASGQTVVVEACTNLLNSEWQPLQTNTLTGSSVFFGDSLWTNHPSRFYRVRSQ